MKFGFNETIQEILRQTRDSDTIQKNTDFNNEVLALFRLHQDADGHLAISREKRINLAMTLVERGQDIADVISLLTWKDFEGLIAAILSENGYKPTESFRRKGNTDLRGMEIDVIGVRGQCVLSIDAKMWSVRGRKAAALRTAAEKQKERTKRLLNQREALAKRLPLIVEREYELYPVLVTWLVEDVELHEGVPVVPVFKFNPFILDFDQYQDIIVSFRGKFS
jgi:hypothetical protein